MKDFVISVRERFGKSEFAKKVNEMLSSCSNNVKKEKEKEGGKRKVIRSVTKI